MLSVNLTLSLSTQANYLGFTKHPITCYYATINCLKQLRCCNIIKIPSNCRQLVVLCPGVTQFLKRDKEEKYIF